MRIIVLVGSILVLLGCSESKQRDDLYRKTSIGQSPPGDDIEPLPIYEKSESYSYSALGMRSPFEPPMVVIGDDTTSANIVSEPNQIRPKESLELINYSALSMVGSLSAGNKIWALIDDGDGRIHRVTKGNYLGKNYGVIIVIHNGALEVSETIPAGKDGWINRPRQLSIDEACPTC